MNNKGVKRNQGERERASAGLGSPIKWLMKRLMNHEVPRVRGVRGRKEKWG